MLMLLVMVFVNHFVLYIVEGYYIADVNHCNPLGFKGELVKQFASIVRRLWRDDLRVINPWKLLRTFRSRLEHFKDAAQQQDAQEFMSFLLDGLHEVCIWPVDSKVG
jgi:ubiquitin C-terminal hydrolase